MSSARDAALDLVSLARVNHQPIVILGLNRSEVVQLGSVSAAFWLPVMGIVMGMQGRWMYAIPVGLAAVVATMGLVGVWLGKVKRSRPEGYYQLYLRLLLEDAGLGRSGVIRRSGVWDTRRHGAEALRKLRQKKRQRWLLRIS